MTTNRVSDPLPPPAIILTRRFLLALLIFALVLTAVDGSDIVAVAAGVVTWAGKRRGYGNLVEIAHGDDLVTRYAHAKTVSVKVGDLVQKAQVVALMGSTGRSTGPHVHFEVLKHGRTTDPVKYMARASH